MRVRLQEAMEKLRHRYRAALKDEAMQKAFDTIWPAWAEEQGAMIYSEILSALDLLILTSTVDNRKEIEKLHVSNRNVIHRLRELSKVIVGEN
jgi:hypothetical protein